MNNVDDLDLKILEALQEEIPVVLDPWSAIAKRLGIPEPLLLERLKRLREAGIIRGISPVFEAKPLGIGSATLVALPVPVERIREVADIVSSYPEVSHNFRRDHQYSLWFTMSAKNDEMLQGILEEILCKTGFSRDTVLDLPTVRRIKIDVRFPLDGKPGGVSRGPK